MMTQSELALQRLIGSLVDLANNDLSSASREVEEILKEFEEQRGDCIAIWPSLQRNGKETSVTIDVKISHEDIQEAIRKVIESSDFRLIGRA